MRYFSFDFLSFLIALAFFQPVFRLRQQVRSSPNIRQSAHIRPHGWKGTIRLLGPGGLITLSRKAFGTRRRLLADPRLQMA